jgi:hypothetical protein
VASPLSVRSGWSELSGSRFFLDLREYHGRPPSIRAAFQLTGKSEIFVNPVLNSQMNRLSIYRKLKQMPDEFKVIKPISKYFWLLRLETICYMEVAA